MNNQIKWILDYQGLWIENQKFGGYPGSRNFPLFLRRLTGLGHAVGGTLFPSEQFDERELFGEIASAILDVDYYMFLVNDLISFYKEFEKEDTILVKNYSRTYNIGIPDALDKVLEEITDSVDRLTCVFAEKNPAVFKPIYAFMHGYVTWHFCNQRYRMGEVIELLDDGEVSKKFRKYHEHAQKTGQIPITEWATPSIGDIASNTTKA